MIELISKVIDTNEGDLVVHLIACSQEKCKYNSNGHCTSDYSPKIFRMYHGGQPYIECRSFEEKEEDKPKEEPKMSNVKITYKSVDKKEAVLDLVRNIRYPRTFVEASMDAPEWANKIDSIYNSKEEDGEIEKVEINNGIYGFIAGKTSPLVDLPLFISVYASSTAHNLTISKQEAQELGQALIKMSEQL